ncbi:MAG: hypothetical protein ACLQGP_06895 [Isosphaeraceae bacterium]
MKALEKDGTRRYDTANGFAADVLRHLAYEPVLAAPPSRAYRMRKFVRKNRGAAIAASLVLLALVGGIAGTSWGLVRADLRRVEAEDARAAETERVTERDSALKVADDRADKLKYQLGVSDFLLASAAYDNRDVYLAAERLGNVPPDQRGWEWRYLKRLTGGALFTLYGHTESVKSASFSPDGTRIVTGSLDNTAKVWDAQTGSPLLELKGHTLGLKSASFSSDGTRIVTASLDKTVKVWDARTGTALIELKGHNDGVLGAAFSPDGTRIVTGSQDRTARVWDAQTGATLLELKGHDDGVLSVAFSPDGTRIVTGGADRTAKVWDARTGASLLDLRGHSGGVASAAYSPDGSRIVTVGDDRMAKVWDARTGTSLLELKGHNGGLRGAAFSPDGTRIVTGSLENTKVWDARTGTPLLELKGHTGVVYGAWFSPDGTRIVAFGAQMGRDQVARVWDARTGRELKGKPIPPAPRSTQIIPDGRWIAQPVHNDVELIRVQPDAEELADRRQLMRPNFRLYREAYDAAMKGNDDFAARFYLNHFPPPERALIRADAIVSPLFAGLLVRDDVLAALQARPQTDSEIQAACLKLAGTWPESAEEFNNVAWPLVSAPGRPEAQYRRGLRLARAACRLEPENGAVLNTLGVAQYRCGLMAEALASLTRSNERNQGREPSDLALLALAQHFLGQSEKARFTLGRLRKVLKNPQLAGDPEALAFLREAETIELDQVFPADPFAP